MLDLRKLTTILEDSIPKPDIYTDAANTVGRLNDTKTQLGELEKQVSAAGLGLCNELAALIRYEQPGLTVSLDRKGLTVSYRSRAINFIPDLNTSTWLVSGKDKSLVRRFESRCGDKMEIGPNTPDLAKTIVAFFKEFYSTL